MDHEDKMMMTKDLADPWRYTKKRTIVDDMDGHEFQQLKQSMLGITSLKENVPPLQNQQTRSFVVPPVAPTSPLKQLQHAITLNNCSNTTITFNVFAFSSIASNA